MSLNSVAEDIRTMLDAGGKGTSGTDLFSFQWGAKVDGGEVDKQVMVRDAGDIDALIKDEYENPTINILVRGDTNEGVKSVHDRARDIYEYMVQQVRQTINSNEYVEFAPLGGLIPIGIDNSNRYVYSMTFYTFRESIGA